MPLPGPFLRSSRSLSAGVSVTIILIFLIALYPHANIRQYNETIHSKLQSKKALKAIVTNVQNEHYVTNALVLGYTLQKYNPTLADQNIEPVLMVPYNHDITPKSMSQLKEVGWIIRYEDDLAIEGVQSLPLNYQRNFIKLRVWRWIDYLKIAWIDADCMVKGDVSLLLSTDFDFAAAQDTWPWTMRGENFNAGVLSLTPSVEEYEFLLNASMSMPIFPNAEQGLLNQLFPLRTADTNSSSRFLRTELSQEYNLNLEAYSSHRPHWDEIWPRAKIVHFTGEGKPRGEDNVEEASQPVALWLREFHEMTRKYGWRHQKS